MTAPGASGRVQEHGHGGGHEHGHGHEHSPGPEEGAPVIVIRPHSGISGDIMVAGLWALAGGDQAMGDRLLEAMGLGALVGKATLQSRSVCGISGLGLEISLPEESVHRTMADVRGFFGEAKISERAKHLAVGAFALIAEAEGRVHGRPPEEVAFHEVGALDSLLDIGLAASLFDLLGAPALVCGPLPMADGTVLCAHGALPSPAPAVSILLEGVAVKGFGAEGETVTPTGLALLKSFRASFGPWPAMVVERQALIYGSRAFPGVPNGALFVLGRQGAPQRWNL